MPQITLSNFETQTGTDVYEVEIHFDGELVSEHFCDCPYDMGWWCKHEVACLFAIRERLSGEGASEVKMVNEKRSKKPHEENPQKGRLSGGVFFNWCRRRGREPEGFEARAK